MAVNTQEHGQTPDPAQASGTIITRTVTIHAPTATVWAALTVPALMARWMAEEPIEIITSWQVGQPILIRGQVHGLPFENSGTVLQCEPDQLLQYTHLSSLSRLPDRPESYTILEFRLTPGPESTTLTLKVWNFPTVAIYKHLVFYWPVALQVLKRLVEQPVSVARG